MDTLSNEVEEGYERAHQSFLLLPNHVLDETSRNRTLDDFMTKHLLLEHGDIIIVACNFIEEQSVTWKDVFIA